LISGGQLEYFDLLFKLHDGDGMDANCVNNVIDNLTSNEIKLRLEAMESANEDLKSTHDELVQGQKKMKTMMHELLAYVKSSWIVRGNLSRLEGQNKK